MKKFLIPVFALAFTSVAFASQVSDAAPDATAVAQTQTPEVSAPIQTSTSKVAASTTSAADDASKVDSAKKDEAGFLSKAGSYLAYRPQFVLNAEKYASEHVELTILATVLATVAAMKIIDYAQASNDEEAQF